LENFPETTRFVIAIQGQLIGNNNYKKHILNDPNITNDICRKRGKKLENIQHATGACRALTQGGHTHHHNQVVNIIHQELAIKSELSRGKLSPYYKY
jgi:hypothetical protein